jgi:type III pantothenate kinase
MNELTYVLDAGNTSVKIGRFENGELKHVDRFPTYDPLRWNDLAEFIPVNSNVAYCSVADDSFDAFIQEIAPQRIHINAHSPLPIANLYETPQSLGMDRLCNAVAIHALKQSKNAVAIDLGTCIKFDLIEGDSYIGGSIAPGIAMRYKSMHDFTAKLPLVETLTQKSFIGTDTISSMSAGVIQGVDAELKGMMDKYRAKFGPDLTFFMTGGDANYFDVEGKNDIFADPNLTLKGVYEIYLCHVAY